MANLMQIKRSETTAVPTSLANGELAWSGNGDILYVGNFGSVQAIGTSLNPGTLTANAVLVANSTSGIDALDTDSLTVSNYAVTSIIDDDTFASGVSNTALASAESIKAYVDSVAGAGVSNLNDVSDVNAASPTEGHVLTWDATEAKWVDADIAGGTGISSSFANSTDTHTISLDNTAVTTGSYGDAATVSTFTVDQQGRLTAAGETSISITASQISNDIALGTDTSGNYVQSITAGALIDLQNGTPDEGITPTIDVDLSELTTSTADGDGDFFVVVDDANAQKKLTKANINISGFNNDANYSTTTGTVTSVGSGNGLTGGPITGTGTLAVGAGNGIAVAADSVAVDGANGISVTADGVNVQAGTNGGLVSNTTGVFVTGGTGVTVDGSGVSIGQAVGTTDNVTFNDLTVSGDLIVSGSTTTVNTTQLEVEDNLISLAANNTTDAVDFGFYGQYDDSGTKYAGLYRDASDGTGVFKLFDALGTEPTGTTISGGSLAALDVGALSAGATTLSSLSLTTDLAVSHGGTGASSFTDNGIIYGNGTSALSVTAAGTEGQVLQAGAGGVPEFGTLDGGSF